MPLRKDTAESGLPSETGRRAKARRPQVEQHDPLGCREPRAKLGLCLSICELGACPRILMTE